MTSHTSESTGRARPPARSWRTPRHHQGAPAPHERERGKGAALHLRYIERDGVEKDGSKGVHDTAHGAARAEDFAVAVPGEKHQLRIIISLEDGAELNLTDFVRRLMATVQRDMG